ncbi:DNA-binding protein [Vibrio harveyi]|nr:DNA-binding protein [Vibrio harveyi]
MTMMNVVGVNIRQLRKQQKITQEQLSAKCNVIGLDISRGTLAKIEAGVRQVTDVEVVLIAKALKVNEGELFPTQNKEL